MPLVSVIVPNYNHAPYLKQRFDSIFNQTFQDFEVIILDDCSVDYSRDIIEQYRNNPKVRHIIYNDINSGSPFKQWAKGFELAQGDYIWIAESDDWAKAEFLSTLIEKLQKDKSSVLAYCTPTLVYENHHEKKETFSCSGYFKGIQFIKDKLCWENHICNASTVVFSKKILREINPDYQHFIGCGDYYFWIQACMQGNIYYESNSLSFFRKHTLSTTKKNEDSGNALIERIEIFHFLKKHHLVSTYKTHCIIISLINLAKKTNNLKAKKMWQQETFSILYSAAITRIGYLVWSVLTKNRRNLKIT